MLTRYQRRAKVILPLRSFCIALQSLEGWSALRHTGRVLMQETLSHRKCPSLMVWVLGYFLAIANTSLAPGNHFPFQNTAVNQCMGCMGLSRK